MSSSSGQATACSAAMRARSVPAAFAEPIIAMPFSDITVRTSGEVDVDHARAADDLGDARDGAVQHVVRRR